MKTAISSRKVFAAGLTAAMVTSMLAATGGSAWAVTQNTLDLRVLLIGNGSADVTTAAWESALSTEGVPYTEVDATGTSPSRDRDPSRRFRVGPRAISTGSSSLTRRPPSPPGQLTALDTYESTFGVSQVDGYMYPDPTWGSRRRAAGALDGTTGHA